MDVAISMDIDKKDNASVALLDNSIVVTPERYPISEFVQFYIVLKRALLFSRRDWVGVRKIERHACKRGLKFCNAQDARMSLAYRENSRVIEYILSLFNHVPNSNHRNVFRRPSCTCDSSLIFWWRSWSACYITISGTMALKYLVISDSCSSICCFLCILPWQSPFCPVSCLFFRACATMRMVAFIDIKYLKHFVTFSPARTACTSEGELQSMVLSESVLLSNNHFGSAVPGKISESYHR